MASAHPPRKAAVRDLSSRILSRIDEATYGTLTASLAASWLAELDEAILTTKVSTAEPPSLNFCQKTLVSDLLRSQENLHERIHTDLPSFEQQLASAKSIQTRLQSLSESVRVLDEAVSDPQVCTLYFRCIPSKFIHAEST